MAEFRLQGADKTDFHSSEKYALKLKIRLDKKSPPGGGQKAYI
jgi:hypothetical protein